MKTELTKINSMNVLGNSDRPTVRPCLDTLWQRWRKEVGLLFDALPRCPVMLTSQVQDARADETIRTRSRSPDVTRRLPDVRGIPAHLIGHSSVG